ADVCAQRADVINPAVRGPVNLEYVHVVSGGDPLASVALIAWNAINRVRAVQRLRKDPRRRRLADAPRSGKQICVRNAAAADRIPQRLADMLLADNIGERLRPESPRQDGVMGLVGGHGRGYWIWWSVRNCIGPSATHATGPKKLFCHACRFANRGNVPPRALRRLLPAMNA